MRNVIVGIALVVLSAATLAAQVKTIETSTTVDSTAAGLTTSKSTTTKVTEEVDVPRNHMITINPLKFLLFYNLSYYHALSNSIVVGGGLQMPTLKDIGGFGANAEMRFHPSGRRMRGFYLAPNVSFNSFSSTYTTYDSAGTRREKISATAFSIGGLLGWQWFPGDDFSMGLGMGVDKYFVSSANEDNVFTVFSAFTGGFTPAFRFDIGYAW